jgi:hypothetical protein
MCRRKVRLPGGVPDTLLFTQVTELVKSLGRSTTSLPSHPRRAEISALQYVTVELLIPLSTVSGI